MLVLMKTESVNMFTSCLNENSFLRASYRPSRLSIIWPSASRMEAPFWKKAMLSRVL